jgi:hypothetical protein
MSVERQPGVLASRNLRREVGALQKQKAKAESPKRSGLLVSNKIAQSRADSEKQTKTQIQVVMEAMAAIREGMSGDTA